MVGVGQLDGNKGFQNAVSNPKVYTVIKFYAPWCGACKMMAPHFNRIAGELPAEQFAFYRMDVESNKDVARQLNIEMLPTFVVYKGGQLLYKQTGTVHDKLRRSLVDLMNNRRVSVS
ncbi:uncharacterized protein LOC129590523 [Paramacrobiotus metropolitanus]|uniref:uncharacterized protein LOC129590523 n=1 Tax=Paramacrobiotus metropolitanus TaxID=2943436 RepID=UPI002445DF16|nr:uncharacterized protein LOC129590523 [Paramacrobiotus metropolitanus]